MKKIIALIVLGFVTIITLYPFSTEVYQNSQSAHVNKSLWGYISMRFLGEPWTDHEAQGDQVPFQPVDVQLIIQPKKQLQATWLGHASFLIQYQEFNILTDPIFSERASPLSFAGPKRFTPLPIDPDALPEIDIVVISHNHYDHLDKATIERLGNKPQYLVPAGLKSWFIDIGIDDAQVTELDWGSNKQINDVVIHSLPNQHWSYRNGFDRNKSHWSSWMFEFSDKTVWFAGDTGYNDVDFVQIGKQFSSVDLALIPIGAYAPRDFMKHYHIDVDEAIKIHQQIRAKISIGMHWGTFPMTAEPVMEPPTLLKSKMKEIVEENAPFMSIAIGETWSEEAN